VQNVVYPDVMLNGWLGKCAEIRLSQKQTCHRVGTKQFGRPLQHLFADPPTSQIPHRKKQYGTLNADLKSLNDYDPRFSSQKHKEEYMIAKKPEISSPRESNGTLLPASATSTARLSSH